ANPQRRGAAQTQHAVTGVIALMISLSGWGIGQIDWTRPAGAPIALRLVQGNVEQGIKFTPSHLQDVIAQHLRLAQTPTPGGSPAPAAILLPETVLAVFQHQLAPSVWQAWIVNKFNAPRRAYAMTSTTSSPSVSSSLGASAGSST
ncbi:MAG: hypothetical protein NTW89_00745, partial [Burkholderiales bacterium]|nr:hypothetical protein [Burkholderiales bacterium]